MTSDLRESVLKKLGLLTEITKIVDRNVEDGNFVRGEGAEIIYVFDTNTVQTFLEPFRNPQYAELFHSSAWGDDYRSFDSINRQSCLLIAEYLMSGKLPGQKNGRWYMSREHYQELSVQIDWLEDEIQSNVKRLKKDTVLQRSCLAYQARLSRALALDPVRDRGKIMELAQRQGESPDVVAELRSLPKEDFAGRAAVIKSRELCRVLAGDRVFEPVDQLRRFRTVEVVGRMQPIDSLFEADAPALARIRADQIAWADALTEAVNARPLNSRTQAALDNDSYTLAYLSWMQKQASSNQRIVLVSGDHALYDAYRRRYSSTLQGIPFLLRPLTQYAPLFNPTNASSSVSDRDEAFGLIRSALEAATVAFNLSLFGRGEKQALARAKEHFISESGRPVSELGWLPLFPNFFDEERLTGEGRKLSDLAVPLQRVERLMLGAYPKLLAQRIDEKAKREAYLRSVKSMSGAALSETLQESLEMASRMGFMFSLPFMPKEISTLLGMIRAKDRSRGSANDRLRMRPRLLISVRLSFPDKGGALEDERMLTRAEILERLDSEKDLPQLLDQLAQKPARVFALAALLAFGVEDWGEAARFADLAATASEGSDSDGCDDASERSDHLELLYMKATSLRFRMSSLRPEPAKTFHDPWVQWLQQSERSLTTCAELHSEKGELAREIRSISERAAVHLAYCEWFAFGGLADSPISDRSRATALSGFERAIEDLGRCYALLDAAERRATDIERADSRLSLDVLESARLQFYVNTAAAILVGEELRTLCPARVTEIDAALRGLPRPVKWPDLAELQPMMRAYILAVQSDWEALAAIDARRLSLPLDQVVIAALQRNAALSLSHPSADG